MGQTFEQYLASSGQQSTADSLRKSGQYGAAESQYNKTGGYGNSGGGQQTSSSGYSAPNPIDIAKQLQQMQIQANQPAIQSLEASKQPLQDRYSSLLDSIKGQGSVAVNAQTLASANELGKRGLLPSSGLFQQESASALAPVTAQYAGITANTGMAQQKDFQDIQNQISSLQAGNVGQSVSGATGIAGIAAQLQAAQMQQQTAQQTAALQHAYVPLSQYGNINQATGKVITPTGGSGFITGGNGVTSGGAGAPPPAAAPKALPPLTSFLSSGAQKNGGNTQAVSSSYIPNQFGNLYGA